MRFREILSEIKLDIPDQMISVQIPLSTVTQGAETDEDEDKIINPGRRAGEDGNYKWSPPLQQQIDLSKDAIGVTNDEINKQAAEIEAEKEKEEDGDEEVEDLKKKIAHLLSRRNTPLGS